MLRRAATFALPAGLALCALLSANVAEAEARYMDLREAVETSEVISVIHTEATASCEIAGDHWTYRQKVFARPSEVLKGEVASPFEMLAQKDFICASVTYDAPADYLVLLHRDDGHLTTLNHGMGALRIEGEQVEWPYGPEGMIPVSDALDQIRTLVGEQPEGRVGEQPEGRIGEQPEMEPQPCGYAVSKMAEQEREEEARDTWLLVGATGAGAAAVMLGFVFGFRRRRRLQS